VRHTSKTHFYPEKGVLQIPTGYVLKLSRRQNSIKSSRTDLLTFRALIASRLGVTVFSILRFDVVSVYNPSSTEHACHLTVHPSSIYNRVVKKKDTFCRDDLQGVYFRICVKTRVLICSRLSCWLGTERKLEQKRDAFAVPRNGTRYQQQSTQLRFYLRVKPDIHMWK
jgi:hypothetical protein